MHNLRLFLLIGLMTFLASTASLCSSTLSQQDLELVNVMTQKNIRLIVMRHGEALHNLTHLMCSTKSPGVFLTEKGKVQIQNTANQLALEGIDQIYVSPVYRTLQTAQLVGAHLNIPYQKIKVERQLREQFFGDFENKTYFEYKAYFAAPEDVFIQAAPGGEAGHELFSRTREFLWKLASNHRDETLLLVTHAFNCSQISQCLTDSYYPIPEQAEYRLYDFSQSRINDLLEVNTED